MGLDMVRCGRQALENIYTITSKNIHILIVSSLFRLQQWIRKGLIGRINLSCVMFWVLLLMAIVVSPSISLLFSFKTSEKSPHF
jgi:hypothetical protein